MTSRDVLHLEAEDGAFLTIRESDDTPYLIVGKRNPTIFCGVGLEQTDISQLIEALQSILKPKWTVAYRCHDVDHMDVTLDYPTEEEARKAFEQNKTFTNLKFTRLSRNGELVSLYRPS